MTSRWGRESWGHNEEDKPKERDAVAAGASVPPPEGPSVEGASLFPAEAAGLAFLLLTPRPSAAFRTRSFRVFVLCFRVFGGCAARHVGS